MWWCASCLVHVGKQIAHSSGWKFSFDVVEAVLARLAFCEYSQNFCTCFYHPFRVLSPSRTQQCPCRKRSRLADEFENHHISACQRVRQSPSKRQSFLSQVVGYTNLLIASIVRPNTEPPLRPSDEVGVVVLD